MTDDEAMGLAVRLVACRHFRPMPGMRDLQGRTWTPDLIWRWNRTIDRPDLRDPATLGCLLALVREYHNEARLAVVPTGRGWSVSRVWLRSPHDRVAGVGMYTLEAEALVAALEAAP
jgi:hypothetical protein